MAFRLASVSYGARSASAFAWEYGYAVLVECQIFPYNPSISGGVLCYLRYFPITAAPLIPRSVLGT